MKAAALLMAIGLAFQAPVAAQQTSTLTTSYDLAIRCFVANGNARGDRQRAGDQAGAARYERQARQSFDAASTFGVALGYSRERIERDMQTRMDRELPLMVRDNSYFRNVVAQCRGVGLM